MPFAPLSEAAPALRRALGYRKFSREMLKVVVLDSGYHLQRECAISLRALGHTVKTIHFRSDACFADILQSLLATLTGFKPDFVLTINHLGFDRDGALGALLERMEVPIAAWYVDSPFFVLRSRALFAQNVTSLFLWDDAYAPTLKRAGAQVVHYLPLAADTDILNHPQRTPQQRYPILFVGDSMQQADMKWRGRIAPESQLRCQRIAESLVCDRAYLLKELNYSEDHRTGDWDLLALATFRATGSYRKRVLSFVPQKSLHLIGDEGWRRVLPQARHHPPVCYGEELARAFCSATINVNATSLQMPRAVNQRVFDVPAAGAFLLTDMQSDMTRHFTLSADTKLYRSPEEAKEFAAFYANKPIVRERATAHLRAQIVQRHTYVHRLQALVHCMRQRHAARGVPVKEAV